MDIDENFSLDHLLFSTRTCRTCGKEKDLLTDFYKIRKNKVTLPSSYSYECKACTIKRVMDSRRNDRPSQNDYPDW
jgi:hypothetical protein